MNTGACDDLARACDLARRARRLGPRRRRVRAVGRGQPVEAAARRRASSGPTRGRCDGHKWLNVPYDSGYVFCADREAHAAAMSLHRLVPRAGQRAAAAPSDYVPESSRRARGFATWAALRELGREGVAELVDRCCALARRFGERLAAIEGVEIGNEVVLNQVLVELRRRRAHRPRRSTAVAARRHLLDGRHHLARPRATCGSRSRTGRRRRPTWTAPSRRSAACWPRSAELRFGPGGPG